MAKDATAQEGSADALLFPGTGHLIVPYGSDRVAPGLIAALDAGRWRGLAAPGAPVAVVDPARRQPLRLRDVDHPFTRPPAAEDLARAAAQLAFLERHLVQLAGAWGKPRQAFVGAYFAAVRSVLASEDAALKARLGPLAGLCERDHFGFSALMPLPRAHVFAPAADRGEGPLRADDFVEVDVAFWTGQALVAVVIDTGATVLPRRRAALARAEVAGAILRPMPGPRPGEAGPALLTALGPPFAGFLEGGGLPDSPFRGSGLPDPVPAGSA